MALYGGRKSGSTLAHVMSYCLTAPSHQLPITGTNIGLLWVRFTDFHLRTISQEIAQPSLIKISLKNTDKKFHVILPQASELNNDAVNSPWWDYLSLMKYILIIKPSNGNIFLITGPLWGESTRDRWIDSLHKGQWNGALMFSLICAWTKGRAINHGAGDLRRHRAHCDITVMCTLFEYLSSHQVY